MFVCTHLSIGCVESLSEFGKVVVDRVVLQSSTVSSQPLVQGNSVSLHDTEDWNSFYYHAQNVELEHTVFHGLCRL